MSSEKLVLRAVDIRRSGGRRRHRVGKNISIGLATTFPGVLPLKIPLASIYHP
jgi:hypothetical protein